MPLQSSGQITFDDIQTFFGGSNPIYLTEYYRGGAYVPNISGNSNIPTSGQISTSNFYGATKQVAYSLTLNSGRFSSSYDYGGGDSCNYEVRGYEVNGFDNCGQFPNFNIGSVSPTGFNGLTILNFYQERITNFPIFLQLNTTTNNDSVFSSIYFPSTNFLLTRSAAQFFPGSGVWRWNNVGFQSSFPINASIGFTVTVN